ncbi:helix-turn-helix domain-containing protein, partial [Aduncisulcus paluster]
MTALKDFEEAEKHFHAVLEGSEYFSMNKNIFSIYTNLAKLQYDQSNYAEAMDLCNKAIACSNQSFPDSGFTMAAWHLPDIPTKAACLYIESAIR